jgi:hypothetical protein
LILAFFTYAKSTVATVLCTSSFALTSSALFEFLESVFFKY